MKVDLRECISEIQERFGGKDLITFEELMEDYEELIYEVNALKEEKQREEEDEFEKYRDEQLERGLI